MKFFPSSKQITGSGYAKFSAAIAFAFLLHFTAASQTTNGLSDAEIQGRQLAQQLCELRPATNSVSEGVLKIRGRGGNTTNVQLRCIITAGSTNWTSLYIAKAASFEETFVLSRSDDTPNTYTHYSASNGITRTLPNAPESSLAGSDFRLGDLGLEFFHWPQQKVLKKDVHRSRGCTVLESTNPNPPADGYSRVVSWIDSETFGIVEANAYDVHGKLLKNFYPKNFKKVHGQYQVESMIMDNVQTGSRTRLEFNFDRKDQ